MTKKNARKNEVVVAAAETQLADTAVVATNIENATDMNQFMSSIAETTAMVEAEADVLAMIEAEAIAEAEAELAEALASDEILDLLPAADKTDPTMPMGENGNELVDGEDANEADPSEAQASDDTAKADENKPVHVPGDLKVLKQEIPLEEKEAMRDEIKLQFEWRRDFEKAQPGLSSKMIPNLDAEEKKMASIGVAGLFLAMNVEPDFINREVSTGSRFNIYAFQKVNDLLVALDGGFMQNAINRAIVTSLFNFRDAGIPFTGQAALCAVSDKIKADRAIVKHLVRHTVSANTASTQKSSTMTALKTLGIVENSGTRGHEVWTLTDTPATRRLEEVVRKAA